MSAPALLATYFGEGAPGEMYRRLALVLEHTARSWCPGWVVRVERIDPPHYESAMGNESHAWNTQKLEWWRARVLEAADGDQLVLIDGDTAVLRPLDPVWGLDFDLAYTVRERGLPLNGGVVFLRVSARTRALVDAWWERNLLFLRDSVAHAPWQRKYAGINQASFGYLLEHGVHGCHLVTLPCREWNCVAWEGFAPAVTRVLHVKSRLRRATFGTEPAGPGMLPLISLWQGLERAAIAQRKAG